MTRKKRLVHGYILDAYSPFAHFDFDDFVHQQKWGPVGDYFLDFIDIQHLGNTPFGLNRIVRQSSQQAAALFFAEACIKLDCSGKNYNYPSPPAAVEVKIRGFLRRTRQHGGEGPFCSCPEAFVREL
ncbi:hypothetical protein D3C75_1057780 [compost metagenome]